MAVDLREAATRLRDEILRQYPNTQIMGQFACTRSNAAFDIFDLAKAALGMRVTRWDQERGDEPTFGPDEEPEP